MYLAYIDESGTPYQHDPKNFILSAVLIHESSWREFDANVENVKRKYFTKHDFQQSLEFHTTDIVRGENPFDRYDVTTRQALLTHMADLIKEGPCTLISVVIDKSKINMDLVRQKELTFDDWVQHWSWRLLLKRINNFLDLNQVNGHNLGLLAIDYANQDMTAKIRSIVRRFTFHGIMNLPSEYIIEDPFFVDSKMRNIIQIADFVSWVMKQWYSHQEGKITPYDPFNLDLFERIKNRFDKGGTSSIYGSGIKIHPPTG